MRTKNKDDTQDRIVRKKKYKDKIRTFCYPNETLMLVMILYDEMSKQAIHFRHFNS